jgi:hypothetical protein
MENRLAPIRQKVERAKKHIFDLDSERAAFLDSNPYVLTGEYYVEHKTTAYFLDQSSPVPDIIRLIAGDAAHNLRSALDYLACALVEANGGTISRSTAFPICESLQKYQAEASGKIKGMRKEACEAIERTKPYCGGNNTLWGIHELDRIDKHRLLVTVASVLNKFGYEIGLRELQNVVLGFDEPIDLPRSTVWFNPPDRKFGAKKGDVIFSMFGNYEADKNVKFTFDVALGEPEVLKGKSLLETLKAAVDTVEDLLPKFAPFLL